MGYVDDRPIGESASQPGTGQVVVKFREGTDLPYTGEANAQARRTNRREWTALDRRFSGLTLRPYFATIPEDRLRSLSAAADRGQQRRAQSSLMSYFAIDCPGDVDADAVAEAVRSWP